MRKIVCLTFLLMLLHLAGTAQKKRPAGFFLNDKEYLENGAVNVMLAHDFYPEGHQGGVGIIQMGQRVATNGDLRLEPTPGQWSPIPKVGKRVIDAATGTVSVRMEYPDSSIDRKGFNPIIYPDLHFAYTIKVKPEGNSFRIIVDLEKPLPEDWIGKVGFNIELFPGVLFGKSWYMDQQSGIFPAQSYSQMVKDNEGKWQAAPMASGHKLVVVPDDPMQKLVIENRKGDGLQLIDGRSLHTNGWYIVRSLVPKGATTNAIEWLVTPNNVERWKSSPVVQVSQVGYHPAQPKFAVVELDKNDKARPAIQLKRINPDGASQTVLQKAGTEWGDFLRYHYLKFDFSSIQQPGMYFIQYGSHRSEPFKIDNKVYQNNVWQPTLEYFLPVQMCHIRVNDKYRVWHGACHLDDALMAPVDSNHFDGYIQGHETMTRFQPGDPVPGLNRGAWHDAGDYDLRVESQAETVWGLTLAYEAFHPQTDNTTIDQKNLVVEIQQPDGKNDLLQQIEHGLLSIVGGYQNLGRFYRGIIEPTLRQYVMLGDPINLTDNKVYPDHKILPATPPVGLPNSMDDRWVFTENNPHRELEAAAALAAASRVMKGYNDTLASQCLNIAQQIWSITKEKNPLDRAALAAELLISTGEKTYSDFLRAHVQEIAAKADRYIWQVGRTIPLINDAAYTKTLEDAVKTLYAGIQAAGKKTPYGVPYEPNIWGAGWGIQNFGFRQYFLHEAFPKIVPADDMLAAINFVLGCHPGSNRASFVSGVGANSMTTGYGFNRADWSYIPGGIVSGTALIRPDFPELMHWPYFWQQAEYVLGGGTTDYLFIILAADHLLNQQGTGKR
ncbi:glycoside hydrolase family 9 protein [Flavihumibacter petaseus]|uniref:Putative glycosidase n=1 Tax=Flavihumibacter petaseus NBRC 106054 TaxID=1220578 RepID=A0A0E9MUB2_9BACT|nr:glycoside hydrolase family 9 protein [Flavihumibacter petaseus]GAO41357.1 putative glycosidase [Flavihumibacter petaseus NBRC 106054]